jgi:uncharacterized protein YwqG
VVLLGETLTNRRMASVLHLGGFRPTNSLTASRFGGIPVGSPGEDWPCFQGQPLSVVCQLNLSEAPYVPPELLDISIITIFADLASHEFALENGSDWRLRTYPEGAALVELNPPNSALCGRRLEGRWVQVEDQPTFFDRNLVIADGTDAHEYSRTLQNAPGTKVGGFASCLDGEILAYADCEYAKPVFCFQVDSEPRAGFSWGGGGEAYFLRGTKPEHKDMWFLEEHAG